MMPGLPDYSIPQCKLNRDEGACLDAFQAIWRFEPTFIEAHHASRMIYKVRSLKSRIKTGSFLEEMIISSNEVFKDFVCDMAVEMRKLGNTTPETAENNDTVKHTVGS